MVIMSLAIVGIVLVVGIILIKMNHFRHRMTIIALLFLALFVYSTIVLVNTSNDLESFLNMPIAIITNSKAKNTLNTLFILFQRI